MNRDYQQYWSSLSGSHSSHPANRYRYRLIAEELARHIRSAERVMDCGCGDGSLLEAVAARISCGELSGMDVAANVPARDNRAIRFHQHDLGQPIETGLYAGFDLVLCSEVIEHVPDDDQVMRNLAALAAKGGLLVVSTQTGPIFRTEQWLGHLRHYDLDCLCHRLQECGFAIRAAYRAGWPWLNLQKRAAHLFQKTVQRKIIQAEKLSVTVKLAFKLLNVLYRTASRRGGPQILIVAERT